MFILRLLIILFWMTTRIGWHDLNTSVCSYCPVLQHCLPPSDAPVCLRPTASPSLLWLVSSYMPAEPLAINYADVWLLDIVWCHNVTELKAGMLTRQRCFLLAGRGLDFLHAQEAKYIKHRRKGKERKTHTVWFKLHTVNFLRWAEKE